MDSDFRNRAEFISEKQKEMKQSRIDRLGYDIQPLCCWMIESEIDGQLLFYNKKNREWTNPWKATHFGSFGKAAEIAIEHNIEGFLIEEHSFG